MVQDRQFAFLGNFQRCRAGMNHPVRAFGGHGDWWLTSVMWELPSHGTGDDTFRYFGVVE